MDGADAVLEPVDSGAGAEIESPASVSSAELPAQTQDSQQPTPDDPYSSKAAKEASAALKAWKDANPEIAKHARTFKDAFASQYELKQVEPRGVSGVRETYALLQSVQHGELQGVEALSALQDEIRAIGDIDQQIAIGNAEVLNEFDDSMKAGIVKMAPAILDMAEQADPEGYAAAVLPHFVRALAGSAMYKDFLGLAQILQEKMPDYVPPERETQWVKNKFARIMEKASNMDNWFAAQGKKVEELPRQNGQRQGSKPGQGQPSELETTQKQLQAQHWNTQIQPQVDQHAERKFEEMFKPYDKRLRLDKAARESLKGSFIQGVVKKAVANPVYKSQMQRYNQQRNPDPKVVTNFAKVEFDKHAKSVLDAIVNERYKPFLAGKPRTGTTTTHANGVPRQDPIAPGIQIVSAKPNNIDFKNTTRDMIHQKMYRLTNGKVVQWRPVV